MDRPASKPTVKFPLDRVIPKAPLGALGGFIQRKLREYVEPSREGTPKGEPIGLSKKKYHAALLAGLTSLDLKQVAREVHVSYDLVRKWRTEDAFSDVGYDAAVEFADGDFDTVAKISLRLIFGFGDTFDGGKGSDDLVKSIHEQKLFGFDDGALYDPIMLDMIINEKHHERFKALSESLEHLKPNEEPAPRTFELAGEYLGWTYCLDRIGRMSMNNADTRTQDSFVRQQHMAQVELTLLDVIALKTRPVHLSVQAFLWYVAGIRGALLKR